MNMIIKNIGYVPIKNAAKLDDGDIEIFNENSFSELIEETIFSVKSAYLVEDDFGWFLYTDLELPEECVYEFDSYCIFEIENQSDIQRLNAFL